MMIIIIMLMLSGYASMQGCQELSIAVIRSSISISTILSKHRSELLTSRRQVKFLTELLLCLTQQRAEPVQDVRVLVEIVDSSLAQINELVE